VRPAVIDRGADQRVPELKRPRAERDQPPFLGGLQAGQAVRVAFSR